MHRTRACRTPRRLEVVAVAALPHRAAPDEAGLVAAVTTVLDERPAAGWRCTLPPLP